ncbi:MAG: hypothetical protein QOD75_731 [Blastocatellia bacterium]|jgi:hypothetical protein|nr:hypothetical protein [Blastocatellia bacterium]
MKQTIKLIIFATMLAVLLPLMSQAQTTPAAAAGECTDEVKSALYTEFLNNRKGKDQDHPNGDQDVAYNAAKKYMAACPADDSAQAQYMKKWMASYEVGSRKASFLLDYDQKKYAQMMTDGKAVLVDDPNYVRGYVLLGYIGYLASLANNSALNAESATYAKQAISMLETGKTPDDWRPFVDKGDALAWLNYSLGFMMKENSPNDAIPYFMKAAALESPLKKSPLPYFFIAEGYEALYAKQEAAYKEKYLGKTETPESKLAQENINQLIDRVIDAYARSVALSTGTDAKAQQKKKEWLERLTELYKYRNKSEAGLNELVAGIMSKPLPPLPTPITTLPTPPPATGTTTTPPATTGGTVPAPTAGNPAPVNKTSTAPKPTPPATTQAAKPKPKANHSRRRP